jgi:neutral trehalase
MGTDSPNVDDTTSEPRRFLIPVDSTLKSLLSREDTDQDIQITIDDNGPKVLSLGTLHSHGHKHFDVRGTYMYVFSQSFFIDMSQIAQRMARYSSLCSNRTCPKCTISSSKIQIDGNADLKFLEGSQICFRS